MNQWCSGLSWGGSCLRYYARYFNLLFSLLSSNYRLDARYGAGPGRLACGLNPGPLARLATPACPPDPCRPA